MTSVGFLGLTGAEPAATACEKVRALQLFMLLQAAVHWGTMDISNVFGLHAHASALCQFLLPVCLAVGFSRRFRRAALVAAAALLLFRTVSGWPHGTNHGYLELFIVCLLAAFDADDPEESETALQAVKWLLVIVFVAAGLQKALHGSYFRGEFLAFNVATLERFRFVFAPLIPDAELARLAALPTPAAGVGPYHVEGAPLFVIASNLVWIAEIGFGLLLLHQRARPLAVAAIVVLLAFIEVGARELVFGGLYAYLLLLFLRGSVSERVIPVFLLYYAFLVAAHILWPQWWLN